MEERILASDIEPLDNILSNNIDENKYIRIKTDFLSDFIVDRNNIVRYSKLHTIRYYAKIDYESRIIGIVGKNNISDNKSRSADYLIGKKLVMYDGERPHLTGRITGIDTISKSEIDILPDYLKFRL